MSIKSDLDEGRRQRGDVVKKLDDLGASMTELMGAVKSVSERHDALENKIDTRVMPVIEEMKNLRSKGLGLMAGVALAAGGASAGATKIFAKLTGG
jgi:hypothetical protein